MCISINLYRYVYFVYISIQELRRQAWLGRTPSKGSAAKARRVLNSRSSRASSSRETVSTCFRV